jgi:hypothetical protein
MKMGETSKPRKLTHAGQPFYDREVYIEVSKPIRVAAILQFELPLPIIPGEFTPPSCVLELPQPKRMPVHRPYERLAPIMEQRGFERVKIRWVRPGPDGTLVPRR